jgi:hypothetical protein
VKHGWVPALVLTALALSGGCRVGYEELKQLGFDEAGGAASGGSAATATGATSGSANGGTSGGSQGGSAQGGTAGTDGGEAGAPSTGGTDTGGSAGSSTGGGGTTGGTVGGRGGAGGAGSGGRGGSAGSAGSSAGGGSGGTGAGAGGGGAGGTSGAGGSGGSAGAPNPALCNTGMFGGHTYLLCKEDRSWFVANFGCTLIGMRLVRIDDAAENQWLFDNAFTELGRRSTVWIGATDQAVDGEWRWTDGTLFWLGDDGGTAQNGLFTAWNQREPNNVSAAEHCAVMETSGSTPEWYDYTCEFVGPFICESL